MKHLSGKIALPPPMIVVLLLTAAILLACGPATQSEPQAQATARTAAQDKDADPTPTPTPDPANTSTEGSKPKYPKLDPTLQKIVGGYEAEEWTEAEAAAQAHTYHGPSVLVTVDFSTNIDTVDTWMEGKGISPRHKNATHIPPNINAFVKVSLVGALSQQEGIIQVKETIAPWGYLSPSQGGISGAEGTSETTGAEGPSGDATGPRLPLWLKGHPYHKLESPLDYLVDRYERGELTEAEAAAQTDGPRGSSVDVIVDLTSGDPANTEAVAAWLESKGVSIENILKDQGAIGAYVPVSMLGALSRQTGVIRIIPPRRPNLPSEKDSGSLPAPQYHLEHFSTGYSIEFPAESKNPGTLAVGAAKWSTPGAIRSYSSRGPTTDGRIKPEIVGADCGRANFYSEAPLRAASRPGGRCQPLPGPVPNNRRPVPCIHPVHQRARIHRGAGRRQLSRGYRQPGRQQLGRRCLPRFE